ncbi:MAG: hypothetical protein NC116_09665 [Clostridium sp.]|nr:hypothetical protein [Clostridium sp.]
MALEFQHNYEDYTDRELVELVTQPPTGMKPNEDGVAFLLYNRYDPLLHKLYLEIYEKHHDFYEDCLGDLFGHLKSGEPAWRKLINLEWRSSFGTWLGITARHRFVEIKPYLIGKLPNPLSIDGEKEDNPVQLPDNGIEEYEDKERKVILMEAISLLKDPDQKFVMIKRLQGYNSKEIAILLQKRWAKHGIVKYNNKKQVVIPDAAYVDVRTQRAKDNLQKIINKLM